MVVQVAFGSALVIEVAASEALGERAEGGLVEGVIEAPVADPASEHDVASS